MGLYTAIFGGPSPAAGDAGGAAGPVNPGLLGKCSALAKATANKIVGAVKTVFSYIKAAAVWCGQKFSAGASTGKKYVVAVYNAGSSRVSALYNRCCPART